MVFQSFKVLSVLIALKYQFLIISENQKKMSPIEFGKSMVPKNSLWKSYQFLTIEQKYCYWNLYKKGQKIILNGKISQATKNPLPRDKKVTDNSLFSIYSFLFIHFSMWKICLRIAVDTELKLTFDSILRVKARCDFRSVLKQIF